MAAKLKALEAENTEYRNSAERQSREYQEEIDNLRQNFQREHPNVQQLIDTIMEKERHIHVIEHRLV